jgi:hypothetical protein
MSPESIRLVVRAEQIRQESEELLISVAAQLKAIGKQREARRIIQSCPDAPKKAPTDGITSC